MRMVARSDLGGYAADKPSVSKVAGTQIEKPFVLLCGPNGSGKTAILRMMRAAMGVEGERAGRIWSQHTRHASLESCSGDLGKLAAYVYGFDGPKLPRDHPGVLDVGAMGWSGQPSWLFDSRAETKMIGASAFDDDLAYHANALVSGAGRVSHGQMLRVGWTNALEWALGHSDTPDPYDAERLPEVKAELLAAVAPTGRSGERWLLLDEPEAALDAEILAVGLAVLLEHAELGKLRVFVASHSPLFAAGLAQHPSVQVLDFGDTKPWLATQQRALEIAGQPAELARIAKVVAGNIRANREAELAAKAGEERKAIRTALNRLSEPAKDLLVKLHEAGGTLRFTRQSAPPRTAMDTLDRRKLLKRTGFGASPELALSPLGQAAAAVLAEQLPPPAP